MKKMLVLHGWSSSPESNWFPWIQEFGTQQWYEVIIPALPDSYVPVLSEWVQTAQQALWDIGPWDVLIGHSMWGKAIMHLVEQYNITGVTCLLVGPSYDIIESELDLGDPISVKKKLRVFNEAPLDFKKLNELGNDTIIFLSDNDMFINPVSARKYYNSLNRVTYLWFHNAGHFMKVNGFDTFEDIFKYI